MRSTQVPSCSFSISSSRINRLPTVRVFCQTFPLAMDRHQKRAASMDSEAREVDRRIASEKGELPPFLGRLHRNLDGVVSRCCLRLGARDV